MDGVDSARPGCVSRRRTRRAGEMVVVVRRAVAAAVRPWAAHKIRPTRIPAMPLSSSSPSPSSSSSEKPPANSVWSASPRVDTFAEMPFNLVTLEYLLRIGRERDLLGYGRVVRKELPIRLARRVQAIQRLPFIVGVNPWIRSVYELYRDSFERITALVEPQSEADLKLLADTLAELTESHQTVIPHLARGFMECKGYMDKDRAREFLDGMIHARIGIRLIAEHYLALQVARDNWLGVVNTQVTPATLITTTSRYVQELCEYNYGSAPDFELVGCTDTRIAYIPVHMEYIFLELVKNAMRATVEFSSKVNRVVHPPIEIAISRSSDQVVVRIRDAGGGIPREDLDRVWEYSYTTVPKYDDTHDGIFSTQTRMNMQQGVGGPIAGLGFGMPMSRIYAKYFGGSLEFRSLHGHGTDLFVRFPNISHLDFDVNI